MAKRGRKEKLTPQIRAQLCEYLMLGNTLQDAAHKAGIGKSTFFRWIQRARQPRAPKEFKELWDAIEHAQAEYRVRANAQMITHSKKHWQALAWFLERTQPKHYGLRVRVHVNEELERMMDKLQRNLTPEEYERALQAIAQPDDSAAEIDELAGLEAAGRPGLAAGVGAAVDAALHAAQAPGAADQQD